jgi:hypothetical protein
MRHNLQNGRKGHREDDAQQAKECPANQNRDQHYDEMQSRFPPHDAQQDQRRLAEIEDIDQTHNAEDNTKPAPGRFGEHR